MEWLTDASDFMPRGQCGQWDNYWRWTYIAAESLIVACFIGLFILIVTARLFGPRRRSAKVALPFALFTLACGLGHMEGAWAAWVWPNYRFFAVWHSLTAAIAIYTLLGMSRYLKETPTKGW